MVRLHVNWFSIGTPKTVDVQYHIPKKLPKHIMPTNSFWRTGRLLFLGVCAILILFFHRLRASQVSIVPYTKNTYKPSTFIFENFTDPLWGPPPYIDWILAWHEILHAWNERAAHFVCVAKLKAGPEFVAVPFGNWHVI